MGFFRRWLVRRLEEADRIAPEETPLCGFWSAMMFLAPLSSPACGAALDYIVFANIYDGSRAKALGVAAGMNFTPALMFAAIILSGMYIIWSHEE